jgi:hypothetical protein
VLFLDGHAEFLKTRSIGNDEDIYLNQQHRLAAGIGPADTVLGPSWATPCPRDEQ